MDNKPNILRFESIQRRGLVNELFSNIISFPNMFKISKLKFDYNYNPSANLNNKKQLE